MTANAVIAMVHDALTKEYPTILAYRIEKCEVIDSKIRSRQSRKRKFDEAFEKSDLNLFRRKAISNEIDISKLQKN